MRENERRNGATDLLRPVTSGCKPSDGRGVNVGNERVDIIDGVWRKPAFSVSRASSLLGSVPEVGVDRKWKRVSAVVYSIA